MWQSIKNIIKLFRYRRFTMVLVERDLSLPARKYKESKRWEFREFTAADLPHCKTHFAHQIEAFGNVVGSSCKAIGGFESETGDLISIAWYSPQDYPDPYFHFTFPVAKDEVFQFAGEVSEPYRNTQISIQLMAIAWQYWHEQGKRMVTSTVKTDNVPSLRMVFRTQWKEAGTLFHFHQWLGLTFVRTEHYEGQRFTEFYKKPKSSIAVEIDADTTAVTTSN